VESSVYVSALKYASEFDHDALVAGIARTYSQRGIAVKSEPALPGGKRADLAVALDSNWTYIEVKTRSHALPNRRRKLSLRQDFLRELLRLRAHSVKQLPRKEASLVVLPTSDDRRKAVNKIAIARSFASRMFGNDSEKILGVMIFTPFRSPRRSQTGWRYACTIIPNPTWEKLGEKFHRLGNVQL
jgi:hypothetical protein